MYTFGGVTPTSAFLIGQSINFTGGVMYTVVKYTANKRKKMLKGPSKSNSVAP